VVAQGVESEEIHEALAGLGCDAAQGNHLCRPLTGQELARWLDRRTERSGTAQVVAVRSADG
jgi:EAL domain-containing protein (putative c-di-GMP-specific phosphodiesterase class I)